MSNKTVEDDGLSPQAFGVLLKRIENLESENAMRQDTIACVDSAYNEAYEQIKKRLKVIEDLFEGKSFKPIHDAIENYIEDFNARIGKLEQQKIIYKQNTIDSIRERLMILEQMNTDNIYKPIESGKKPHKCPVCDGCGNDKGIQESHPNFEFFTKYASCHSCEGKGIVWG